MLNGCRSVLRRRGIARRATLVHRASQRHDEALASAESEVILSEDRRQVLAALARLPRRRREVLVLRYYLGLSEADIAAVLGISPGTVKSTAARGLAALARDLGENAMTRTEERLADALRASAGQVRDDRLRQADERAPGAGQHPGRRRGTRGLARLAGAGRRRGERGPGHRPGAGPGRRGAGRPRPRRHGQQHRQPPLSRAVRRREAGRERRGPVRLNRASVVETAPSPHRAGWTFRAYAMAAAPDGRTFYAAYIAIQPDICSTCALPHIWIYRLSPAGRGLTMIKGGVIRVPLNALLGTLGAMAVSPDGTKLALTVARRPTAPASRASWTRSSSSACGPGARPSGRAAWTAPAVRS